MADPTCLSPSSFQYLSRHPHLPVMELKCCRENTLRCCRYDVNPMQDAPKMYHVNPL
ncbi:hypothetical protein CY34DRAFT_802000 [Suillus luteus UH-Slu-Lm8-n1]|uniref:Uncharacterized protein n=1 Tax=Suillus luteus UH-Slu-Lm8-n1 TaxID=930992 RepID=A0A0D0BPH9_9AGAM|nr:hypothetical protein CY34DRAFT_802000 [Suillus luteus UH-Slu-Lm8-n1]